MIGGVFTRRDFLKIPGMTPAYFSQLVRNGMSDGRPLKPLLIPIAGKQSQGVTGEFDMAALVTAHIAAGLKKSGLKRNVLEKLNSGVKKSFKWDEEHFEIDLIPGVSVNVKTQKIKDTVLRIICD